MPMTASFDYTVLRVVPRVEREEFINAGVVVFCLEKRYLAARILLDRDRLRALWPGADAELVLQHLEAVRRVCSGDPAAGPIARLSQRERFHWVSSPRSTIIQPSPVHGGVCEGTEELLEHLSRQLLVDPGPGSELAAQEEGCREEGVDQDRASGSVLYGIDR